MDVDTLLATNGFDNYSTFPLRRLHNRNKQYVGPYIIHNRLNSIIKCTPGYVCCLNFAAFDTMAFQRCFSTASIFMRI